LRRLRECSRRIFIFDVSLPPACSISIEARATGALSSPRVVAGLDPATHDEVQQITSVRSFPLHGIMDARVKPAHDAECMESLRPQSIERRSASRPKTKTARRSGPFELRFLN
jgi:hypothetical protein